MDTMRVFVERVTQEAQLSMRCACGGCHPTATVYRDDPRYGLPTMRRAGRAGSRSISPRDGALLPQNSLPAWSPACPEGIGSHRSAFHLQGSALTRPQTV